MKWSIMNKDVLSDKKGSTIIEESVMFDTYDFNDIMASSEAISEAAVAKYVAKDLLEEFFEFNTTAEEKGYNATQYISEAFDVKGIVKKVFDVLVRFWGVIVGYIKSTLSKFTNSADMKKRLLNIMAEIDTLSQAQFDKSDKVKFKRFGLNTAVAIGGVLLDAKTYINTPLVKDDKLSTIARITAEAAQLADVDLKFDRGANGEKQKVGASDLNSKSSTLKDLNDRIISITKSIGMGKNGGVGVLMHVVGKQMIGTGADLKTSKAVMDLPEISKAKDVSNMLRGLLLTLFPSDAEIYESGNLQNEVKYVLNAATAIYHDSKNSQLVKGNNAAVSDDGFEEARKQAQDILDQLKSAASKIGQFKATDVDTNNDKNLGAKKDNESGANDLADVSGKLSSNLMEVQTSMQEAMTKGMDAGLVLIKTVLSELEFRVKSLRSLVGGRKEASSNMKDTKDSKKAPDDKKDDIIDAEIVDEKEDKNMKNARALDAGQ